MCQIKITNTKLKLSFHLIMQCELKFKGIQQA